MKLLANLQRRIMNATIGAEIFRRINCQLVETGLMDAVHMEYLFTNNYLSIHLSIHLSIKILYKT